MEKKGLIEFQKVFDLVANQGWLALDLAQNLRTRYELTEEKKVQEDDVKMAYALADFELMQAVHALAHSLGFTREDYIEDSDKRRGEGNCNVYIMGQGSISCNLYDVVKHGR